MTKRALILASLAIAFVVATAFHESRLLAEQRAAVESGQRKIAQLALRVEVLRQERDAAQQRLALLGRQHDATGARDSEMAASPHAARTPWQP